MNKSEQLIACLEGEIAKRDETIARLEPQLNRAIQANYDLREELAACRVAVENCEVFRARIAELERAEKNDAIAYKAVLERQDELRAELAALKAQEPVAYIPVDRETGEEWHPVLKKGSGNICDYKPLYAALSVGKDFER